MRKEHSSPFGDGCWLFYRLETVITPRGLNSLLVATHSDEYLTSERPLPVSFSSRWSGALTAEDRRSSAGARLDNLKGFCYE